MADDVAAVLAAMGPRLRAAREKRGDTLSEVSRATGIASSTLSRVENGLRKPNLELLLRLAKAYGVSLDALAGTTPAATQKPSSSARQRGVDDKAVLPLTRYVGGCTRTSTSCRPPTNSPHGRASRRTKDTNGSACCRGGCGWHSATMTSS